MSQCLIPMCGTSVFWLVACGGISLYDTDPKCDEDSYQSSRYFAQRSTITNSKVQTQGSDTQAFVSLTANHATCRGRQTLRQETEVPCAHGLLSRRRDVETLLQHIVPYPSHRCSGRTMDAASTSLLNDPVHYANQFRVLTETEPHATPMPNVPQLLQ